MRWKLIGGEGAPLGEALRALARSRGWSEDEEENLCAFLLPAPGDSGTGAGDKRGRGPRTDGRDPGPFPSDLLNVFQGHPAYIAARDCIRSAAGWGHRIILFGDYDADGITSVAQVYRFLSAAVYQDRDRERERDLSTFVPDRMRHGYGLTKAAVEECLATNAREWAGLVPERSGDGRVGKGSKRRMRASGAVDPPILLIALDCGSASLDVVAGLKTRGIDTIVVDHHQPHDSPSVSHPAVAHLNPHAWKGDQPGLAALRTLSASGLAFLLCDCLRRDLNVEGWNREAGCVLAGLGTLADVVPLIGPNRGLVREALRHANVPGFLEKNLPGLAKLHERSGGGMVDARTLGYRWGPRVNASGRIDDARAPLDLLLADGAGTIDHPVECRERSIGALAEACERANDHRKRLTEEALDEAEGLAAERLALERFPGDGERTGVRDRVLVLGKESWEPGIVGIVAGRLRERLGMPVIILGRHPGQETWKGSGRSVAEYDLGAEVRCAVEEGLAAGGGGHHLAAGVTIAFDPAEPAGSVEKFRAWLNDRCALAGPDLEPEYEVLAPVHAVEALDRATRNPGDPTSLVKFWCDLYDRFEPFGAANPRPGLLLRDVELMDCRAKTTTKGVKTDPGAGGDGTRPPTRDWALSARFRWNGGDSLVVDWTDPKAARQAWGDPETFTRGTTPAARYNLVVEPHRSAGTGKGARTWYDWRVVACARIAP